MDRTSSTLEGYINEKIVEAKSRGSDVCLISTDSVFSDDVLLLEETLLNMNIKHSIPQFGQCLIFIPKS